MAYHGHNQHGQFGSAAARAYAPHPQQTNNNNPGAGPGTANGNAQIPGLHNSQQQQQQQYASHMQHHNTNSGGGGNNSSNNAFGLGNLTANSYKFDNRDARQNNGLQYGNMSSGTWSNPTDMTGFGQPHSTGQLSHIMAQQQPHHSAPQASLSLSQYAQPTQPQAQQQQQQLQQHQQQAFLFPPHGQSAAHLRVCDRYYYLSTLG
jgi:hypothetical protein